MKKKPLFIGCLLFVYLLFCQSVFSQPSAFTFQGNLVTAGVPSNGNHDFEFALFDTLGGANQIGPTLTRSNVVVTNGVFSVSLDFDNSFSGANRFLEIRVRTSGGGAFTTLTPRQAVNSSPYSIKSLNAGNATNAATATNATQLGGVAANQYVLSGATSINAATQFNIGGNRVLSAATSSVSVGLGAGASNSGTTSTFVGDSAGMTSSGARNSFVGASAGRNNTTGSFNVFFGSLAGIANTTGSENAFVGDQAGLSNTVAGKNSFFGFAAGLLNVGGNENSFFGHLNGASNSSGSSNSFFGSSTGVANTTGSFNAFYGARAGEHNTIGASNTFVGFFAGNANTTANDNSFFGAFAGEVNTTGTLNAFFGKDAGKANTTGGGNSFFGARAGAANTTGTSNSFFGTNAGDSNTTGIDNAFFGNGAGASNTIGARNAFFGERAGTSNTTGTENAFFGNGAGLSNTGNNNTFVGMVAGQANSTGNGNSFFGSGAGDNNTTGSNNSGVGRHAGFGNVLGSRNSYLGVNSDSTDGLLNATAIGNQAFVTQSNSLVLGSINGTNGATADTNVGIGTTAPERILHLRGPGPQELMIESSDAAGRKWTIQSSGDGGAGRFEIVDRTAVASRLAILDSGNIGIGTTAPARRLHVANGSSGATSFSSSDLVVEDAAAAFQHFLTPNDIESGILFGDVTDSIGGGIVFNNAATNNGIQFRAGGNTPRMTLTGSGSLGIGTASPADRLDVNGDIRIGTGGTGCLKNNSGATIIGVCSSDLRFKERITPFPNLLDNVSRLRPVHYYWRAEEFPTKHFGSEQTYGLIAQEVEQILPELVSEDEQGYKQVDYSKLPLLTIQAVKEQQEQINKQAKTIARQQAEIDELKRIVCSQARSSSICKSMPKGGR
jgi:hypothetical protein